MVLTVCFLLQCGKHSFLYSFIQFDFSIFDTSAEQMTTNGGKYPAITPSYESIRTSHLYFGGCCVREGALADATNLTCVLSNDVTVVLCTSEVMWSLVP